MNEFEGDKIMSKKRLRTFWLISLIACLCLGALALVVARPHSLSQWADKKPPAAPLRPTLTQTDKPRAAEPVRNISFTLYDVGILPREIHVQKGLIAIAIEDRTRKSGGLVIERDLGNGSLAVGQVKRVRDESRGRTALKLAPGKYSVFDASQPGNRARLIVEP